MSKLRWWNGQEWQAIDLSSAAKALLDDANAAALLTTLGVSAFAQTALDDANAAALRTTIAAAADQDPLGIGVPATAAPSLMQSASGAWNAANRVTYHRLICGGIAFSSVKTRIVTASGNVCVAAYTNSGTGTAARPTGGRLATTGSIACPSAGFDVTIALGSTITPNKGDWLAFGCDNTTLVIPVFSNAQGSVTSLACWAGSEDVFPASATPSLTGGVQRHAVLLGV